MLKGLIARRQIIIICLNNSLVLSLYPEEFYLLLYAYDAIFNSKNSKRSPVVYIKFFEK